MDYLDKSLDALKQINAWLYSSLPMILEARYNIKRKLDGSPVTSSDLFINSNIKKILEASFDEFVFISEESPLAANSFIENSIKAIVDPLDGTENFCAGLQIWGVSISLYFGSMHIASLIALPELNKHVMTGQVLDRVPVSPLISGLSSSLSAEFLQQLSISIEPRIMGCCVYNMYNVIIGSYKTFSNPKGAYAWDIVAGLNLALASNCSVIVDNSVYAGQFLDPHIKHTFSISHQ